jgi:hypothetical protein
MESGDEYRANKIFNWRIEGASRIGLRPVIGGKWRGINPDTKGLLAISYDYEDGIKDTILLGKKSIFPDISDTDSTMALTGDRNPTELKNVLYDKWCKQYSIQNSASIMVEGNPERYAGHLINIEWPSYDKKQQLFQKQLEGLWLVKSITHHWNGRGGSQQYMQKMVLIKNGFFNSSSKTLLNAEKHNLTGGVKTTFLKEE